MRESFRDERGIMREFQDSVGNSASSARETRVDAIASEFAAGALVVELAPDHQPTLFDRCDFNKPAEVFP